MRTRGGAVACVERRAAEIGAHVLARGGNAVDATVATAFALAVTWPPAGNIGGGGVMLIALEDGRHVALDYRESAPQAVTRELFLDAEGSYVPERALDPYLCAGVPGSVAGLALAHERFGSLPWAELVQPAVQLAREGFVVDAWLARFLEPAAADFARHPAGAAVFLDSHGAALAEGASLVQSDLAETLQAIADRGVTGFYSGPVAQRLVADMTAHGGLMTLQDLADYRAVLREPLAIPFAGRTVLGMPPPSSGGLAMGQILGQLERHDVLDVPPHSVAGLHLYAESARRAFAERARWVGDPAHTRVPVEWMLAPATLDGLAHSISRERATPSSQLGPPVALLEPEHTTHISVIDRFGNAVANTTTLEANCGSRTVATGTGVLLNNQLRDFNRIPGQSTPVGHIGTPANLAGPGRRPLTSMSPVIVLSGGRPVLATGSPGGRTIINTVTQIVLAVVGRGLDLETAVRQARVHHQWFPDRLDLETGFLDPAVIASLEHMGHTVRELPAEEPLGGTQGAAHSVAIDPETGEVVAVGDPRREGWAGAADN